MFDFWQGIRLIARSLLKDRAYVAVTVVTLALAIGVNSAIFSMVSAVFLSDLPIEDGETLGFVFTRHPERGGRGLLSLPDFLDYRDGVTAFAEMGALRQKAAVLTGTEEPARVVVAEVTANLFDVWGVRPMLGRGFRGTEDRPGAERVAVLGYGAWQRRFGADPEIVGETVRLDGFPTTIVGVLGPDMEFGDLSLNELWRPMVLEAGAAPRDRRDLFVTGRLAVGATLGQAQAEVEAISRRLAEQYPDANAGWSVYVADFNEGLASSDFWTILMMLAITVGLVMLIACSNVATMTLARTSERARELAVRSALGAGRLRMVRQLLAEAVALSLIAGSAGLLVAGLALDGLVWMAGNDAGLRAFFGMLEIDRNVLLFTLAVALLSPLLFALMPAVRVARQNLAEILKEGGQRSGGAHGPMRGRRFLVATQVSLALMLMIVAGMLIRSMIEVRAIDFPYDPQSILTMRIELPDGRYAEESDWRRFQRDAIDRVRALPEVVTAAWATRRPIADSTERSDVVVRGRADEGPGRRPSAGVVVVDPGYFEIVGLRLLRGRFFEERDMAGSLPVALINREMVERLWPGEDPIGQHLRLLPEEGWLEIVGVVESLPQVSFEDVTPPTVYLPLAQAPRRSLALLLQPRGEAPDAAAAVRRAVRQVDPEQPVGDVRTMAQIHEDDLAAINTISSMFVAFAVFALAMSAAGIYGVFSYSVAQRTREFGIRMALGARAREIRGMVMAQSAWLLLVGAAIGLFGGFALATVMAAGVDGVEAVDAAVYAVVLASLTLVGALSAWAPARRATRTDPMVALRTE